MKKSIIALRAGVLFFCCPLYGFSAMTDSQCTAQPAFDGSMQGVYTSGDNRYAIFNGCKYVLSGVGVGTNDASVWSGHWSPVSASTADGSGSGNTNSGTASSGSGNTGSSSGVPSTAGSSGTGSSSLSSPGSSISLTPGNLPTSSSAFETTTLGTNGPLYVAMSLTTSPSTVYAIGNEPDALAFYSLMRKLTAEDSFFLAKPTSDPCNTTTLYSGSNGAFQLPSCQKNNFKLTLTSKNSYSGSNSVSYSYNISYDYTYYNNSAVCMTASDGKRYCDPSRSVASTSSQSSTYSIQVMANAAYYSGSSTGTVTPPPSGTASGSGTGSYSTCSYVDSSGKVMSYTAPYGTSCSSSGSSSTGTSGNTAAGSSSSAGSAFDYDRMAKAIRDGLTENYDESATQKSLSSQLDDQSKSIMDSLSSLNNSISGLTGNGGTVGTEFRGSSSLMAQIGEGDKSPLLDTFLHSNLFPSLPSPQQCRPIVFGQGQQYEFSIDCKYINTFKAIFAFILYFWTFVTLYDSFTGVLRKPKV